MGGWHAAGIAMAGDEFGVRELLVRAEASDSFLNRAANHAVADGKGKPYEKQANARAGISPPKNQRADRQPNAFENGAAVEDVDEPIQE